MYTGATGGTGTANSPFTTPILINAGTTASITSYYVACESGGSPNCISTHTQVNVTVNPLPIEPSASNKSICYNTSASLTATCTSGSIVWYGSATATTGTAGSLFNTPLLTPTSYFTACESGGSPNCGSIRT